MFRAAICKRLLHSGASTNQILEMYIAMIRALRVLDPSDLVLNFIAAPVRTYLMGRRDTVRCIVSSFTKNKDSDLHGKFFSVIVCVIFYFLFVCLYIYLIIHILCSVILSFSIFMARINSKCNVVIANKMTNDIC